MSIYDDVKTLNQEEKMRYICDRLDELSRDMKVGTVWDNKVQSNRRTDDTEIALAELDQARSTQVNDLELAIAELSQMVGGAV